MIPESTRTPNARRQAAYRQRKRERILTINGEMTESLAEALVASGVLDKSAATDATARGAALVAAARLWLCGMAKKTD